MAKKKLGLDKPQGTKVSSVDDGKTRNNHPRTPAFLPATRSVTSVARSTPTRRGEATGITPPHPVEINGESEG